MRDEMKTRLWAKEMNHLRDEFELFVARQFVNAIDRRFQADAAIKGFKNYSLVSARFTL